MRLGNHEKLCERVGEKDDVFFFRELPIHFSLKPVHVRATESTEGFFSF